MSDKIELFNMLLIRTELCRVHYNAKAQLRYATKRYLENNWSLEQLNVKAVNAKYAGDVVRAFTKKTIKRRRQLMMILDTHQNKSSSNTISGVRVADTYYSDEIMLHIVQEHEVEQILLGDNS